MPDLKCVTVDRQRIGCGIGLAPKVVEYEATQTAADREAPFHL